MAKIIRRLCSDDVRWLFPAIRRADALQQKLPHRNHRDRARPEVFCGAIRDQRSAPSIAVALFITLTQIFNRPFQVWVAIFGAGLQSSKVQESFDAWARQ
jgi:hypothetical protein